MDRIESGRRLVENDQLRTMDDGDRQGEQLALPSAPVAGEPSADGAETGEIHGLEVLAPDIEEFAHNTTRFLVMSRQRIEAEPRGDIALTSCIFEVRNVPAALYKAMGGVATNGANMVKLESHMLNRSFSATQFYAEVEGHPQETGVAPALEELGYFTQHLKVLGFFPRAARRGAVGPPP